MKPKPLNQEDCQWLKDVGFPQIRNGDFWCVDSKSIFYDDGSWAKESPDEYFACPSLEELWDGAEKLLREYRGEDWGPSHIAIKPTTPACEEYAAIEMHHPLPNYTSVGIDADRKVAIVKLLRAVLTAPTKKDGE
jgi:hypothetical protein